MFKPLSTVFLSLFPRRSTFSAPHPVYTNHSKQKKISCPGKPEQLIFFQKLFFVIILVVFENTRLFGEEFFFEFGQTFRFFFHGVLKQIFSF